MITPPDHEFNDDLIEALLFSLDRSEQQEKYDDHIDERQARLQREISTVGPDPAEQAPKVWDLDAEDEE